MVAENVVDIDSRRDVEPEGPSQLGVLIRTRRLSTGQSQTEFGHEVGVRQAAVAKWETKLTTPQARLRQSLASALGITVEELVERASTPASSLLPEGNPTEQSGTTVLSPSELAEMRVEFVRSVTESLRDSNGHDRGWHQGAANVARILGYNWEMPLVE